jgi:Xaa-Pro dipeptidase
MVIFERAEYLERLAKTKARMAERGIDVLLVSDPSNMYYLSGYDAWSFYVPQTLLVALDEEEPVWIGRGIDASAAKQTAFVGQERIVSYPDHYVQSTERHPMHFLADYLRERGWERRSLGLELGAYYFTAQNYFELTGKLPNTPVIDASLLVNWVRVVKSPQEIVYMQEAARIVEHAMATAIEAIEPGVRQCDVAGKIYNAQISGLPEYGGTYTSSPPFIPTGERSSAPHLVWTDAPYRPGEPTTLELVACRHRYHAPLSRTVFLGAPPARVNEVGQAVIEGLTAALESVKPGVTAESVEAVWRKTVGRYGVAKEARVGYSIGIAYPPTFGELTISLRPGDRTVLQENMTLHLMTSIWLEGWGIVTTESFRVTRGGYETLCNFPRRLFVKA